MTAKLPARYNSLNMYALLSQIEKLPIVSLQTGQKVAQLDKPIINRSNLELMAFYCQSGYFRQRGPVILSRDIRQINRDCLVIDSVDEIENPQEIVRLQEVIRENFDPKGRIVVNETGIRLGKVTDYNINLQTNLIQKLYVKPSAFKHLVINNLVIDRSQIVDISDRQITVRDATVKKPVLAPQPAPQKN